MSRCSNTSFVSTKRFRCGIRCTDDTFFSDKIYIIPRDSVELAEDFENCILNADIDGGFLIIDKDTEKPFWKTTFNILRKMLGVSQEKMTKVMNIPRRTVQDWELGNSEPPIYVQSLVAEKMRRLILKDFC